MDADSIVNRDDPIPVLTISSHDPTDGGGDSSHALGHSREGSKKPSAKLKDSISRAVDPIKAGPSMQDRLFSTSVALQCHNRSSLLTRPSSSLFQQVLGSQEEPYPGAKLDRRSRKYVERPNFSLPQMSTNFRRFNAR